MKKIFYLLNFLTVLALGQSNIQLTAPTIVSGIPPISVANNTVISIPQANSVTDGYLSSTDWNTFNTGGVGNWKITGQALGTNTNFIGPTDKRSFLIKTYNLNRLKIDSIGRLTVNTSSYNSVFVIDSTGVYSSGMKSPAECCSFGQYNLYLSTGLNNASFGYGAMFLNTTGSNNSAHGDQSLRNNTIGVENAAFANYSLQHNLGGSFNSSHGNHSLDANTTGSLNSGYGFYSAFSNSTASNGIAIGSYSGYYNVSLNRRLFVNSLDRSSLLNDTTASIIYGYQDATASSQRLYLNAKVFSNNAILSTSKTQGVGYAVGSGSTITQATSRTTGVTINAVNGAITLVSAAGSALYQTFTVTNSAVAASDVIIVNQKSGTDLNLISITNVAAGSFKISFATTGGVTVEQPVFNFAVIKAVTN